MNLLEELLVSIGAFLPLIWGVAITGLIISAVDYWFFRRRDRKGVEEAIPRQLVLLVMFAALLVEVLILVPMDVTLREQVLGLMGVVVTAVIGISSTTFVSNAMAGFLIRVIGNFRPGDFIRIGDEFGRVTERGLFHVQIQTEDRDLTTLPNLRIVTSPVTVIHRSGTIVSATLSLGYDQHPDRILELLRKAVERAGLSDPFVLIRQLGDHSITYRASGFYEEVKQLLTTRSELLRSIVQTLHEAGVEIVSPSFMNQRQLDPEKPVVPDDHANEGHMDDYTNSGPDVVPVPESIIFDKAEEAAALEDLRESRQMSLEKLEKIREQLRETDGPDAGSLKHREALLESRIHYIDRQIELHQSRREEG